MATDSTPQRQPAQSRPQPQQTQTRPPRRRRIGRMGALAIGLILVLIGRYASARVLDRYPAPGQFVIVSGARMHYHCQGSGKPTLVLQAGFGGGALDWRPLTDRLTGQFRVCAFDRLGQDYSDPAPHPRTFGTAADELHQALIQLGIDRPVIVGHSLGGAIAQVYAARYPVGGLILVEGLTTDDVDAVVERLGSYQSLDWLAATGLLRPIARAMVTRSYPAELQDQMVALRAGSDRLLALTDEGAVAARTAGGELRAAEAALQVPMLLIGAAESDVPGLPLGRIDRSLAALAERKPGAVYVQVAAAGHYVQADQPDEVARAITTWLHR